MWHLADHRPGYLTIVDLWDVQPSLPDGVKLIRTFTVVDVPVSLYWNKYPSDLYLTIGENPYHFTAREWETKDKPVRFTVALFDKGTGRQYIRFVIFMDRGYKKAGAFFIAQREDGIYYTPLECRYAMDKRIQEMRAEAEKPPTERFLGIPSAPRLDPFSALNKSKQSFFNSTDLLIFKEKKRHWKPVHQSTLTEEAIADDKASF